MTKHRPYRIVNLVSEWFRKNPDTAITPIALAEELRENNSSVAHAMRRLAGSGALIRDGAIYRRPGRTSGRHLEAVPRAPEVLPPAPPAPMPPVGTDLYEEFARLADGRILVKSTDSKLFILTPV